MRKLTTALCAALVITPIIAASADAQGRLVPGMLARPPSAAASPPPSSGGSVGGGQPSGAFNGGGGGFRGDGFRGDGFRRGGGFYGGGFYGSGLFFGPAFGFYDPFWWPYGSYGYPYYSYAPRTVIVREPSIPAPNYLLPPEAPPPQASWYRCSDPEGFYPYVRECNGPWQAVPVNPQGTPPDRGPPPGR